MKSQESYDSFADEDPIIQEYNQLDFSDERSDDRFSSSSENACRQLSDDKLKFLGVDRFPIHYAQKLGQETQEETYLKQALPFNQSHSHYENNQFNIDSFLNSNSVGIYRNNQIDQGHQSQLEYKPKKSHGPYYRRNQARKQSKSFSIIIEEKGSTDSEPSLISLPQPDVEIPKNPNRNYYSKLGQRNEPKKQAFAMRFQQAKLNFMDSFLPEDMRIKNNPYSFYKYTQRKGAFNLMR